MGRTLPARQTVNGEREPSFAYEFVLLISACFDMTPIICNRGSLVHSALERVLTGTTKRPHLIFLKVAF